MSKRLYEAIDKLEVMAKEKGIDFYEMKYEIVPQDVMLEVMSYGLPTRSRHWKYGASYEYQKISGEMGSSKVYELVLNNSPSYAFLLNTNSDIANIMVSAHVLGHSHFFKNNYLFKKTNNKMVYTAAERAARIDSYIHKYGIEEVEQFMDFCFAIEKNIDWFKGENRDLYEDEVKKVIRCKNKLDGEYDDLLPRKKSTDQKDGPKRFPPYKEYDLLWFLMNYGSLKDWQRDVVEIIRAESFYFYPQYYTKIMNEGFASMVHADLMVELDSISHSEFLEYSKIHERVVQSGVDKFNINPYYLGFTILNNIRDKYDELYKKGESDIAGQQKVYQVVEEEDDISFLRNYLTQELVDEMDLFAYIRYKDKNGGEILEITSRNYADVAEFMAKDIFNYRVPSIYIESMGKDFLNLVHDSTDVGTLDTKHLKKVMSLFYKYFDKIIDIKTIDDDGETTHITFDEEGCSL